MRKDPIVNETSDWGRAKPFKSSVEFWVLS